MEYSDKLVLKSFEIIDYFKPEYWFLENPQTGNLKNRDIMKDKPFYDVDYCMYSDWGYRKRTRIWTNKKNWNNLLCDGSGSCGNMITIPTKMKCRKLHKTNCGNTEKIQAVREHLKHSADVSTSVGGGTNRLERYRVPEDLILSLFSDE